MMEFYLMDLQFNVRVVQAHRNTHQRSLQARTPLTFFEHK